MSEQINWLAVINHEDIPKKARDPLSDIVMDRFNGAVAYQSAEQVNGKPLRDVLLECWQQQNGVLSCEDAKRAEALGVDATVNLTALKASVANAFLTDAMTSGTSALPWLIQPTPRPDISPESRIEVLEEVKQMLFSGQFMGGGEIVDTIRQLKLLKRQKEREKAERAAREMDLLFQDQCAEGGFHRALRDFLQYFPIYPFAVFAGPYITRAPRLVWGEKKPRMATEVFPTFRAISPFDFAYSPDSPDTQRGTCIFTRTLWTRRQLLDAAKMPSYIQENVLEVLKEADRNADFNLNWLSRAPDDIERNISLWSSNVRPIEVLTHYGIMSGRELEKYNVRGLERTEFYNCEIAMAGYRVIQVRVMSDPKMQVRPVFTASFYRTGGDRIAGDGIAQRLRDIERAYHSCLMYLMRNAANASAPMCEADYKRIKKYLSDEDIGLLIPGTMYMADPDNTGGSHPAMKFFNIPSNIPAYSQLMEMFMQLADRVTNIPAALHGEAVGSGAMRTFRGMSLLQGNATKALHAAVDNISNGVFDPMGHYLYDLNMIYAKDASVKGDAQIVTKGAEGILQKEMQRQSSYEILQLMGSVGAQLGGMINVAPVIAWSIEKLLGAMEVPDEVLDAMKQPAPQMQQSMPAPRGISGGNPNPNPDPGSGGGAADIGGGMYES